MLIKDGFLRTEHEIAGLYQSEVSARYGSSLSTQRAVYIKEASVGMVSRAGRSQTEANPCPRARFQNTPHAVSDSAVKMMICNHERRYQMTTFEAALFWCGTTCTAHLWRQRISRAMLKSKTSVCKHWSDCISSALEDVRCHEVVQVMVGCSIPTIYTSEPLKLHLSLMERIRQFTTCE